MILLFAAKWWKVLEVLKHSKNVQGTLSGFSPFSPLPDSTALSLGNRKQPHTPTFSLTDRVGRRLLVHSRKSFPLKQSMQPSCTISMVSRNLTTWHHSMSFKGVAHACQHFQITAILTESESIKLQKRSHRIPFRRPRKTGTNKEFSQLSWLTRSPRKMLCDRQ